MCNLSRDALRRRPKISRSTQRVRIPPPTVIARSPCDEAIHPWRATTMDCFAALAMTVELIRQLLGVALRHSGHGNGDEKLSGTAKLADRIRSPRNC
jgi:hypothetical protein